MTEEALSADLGRRPHSDTQDPGKALLDGTSTPARGIVDGRQGSPTQIWNRWAPDALHSPLAPADLVEAFNRWQPNHLKIRRAS